MLGTFLEMDEGRTPTNGAENKKDNDNAKGLRDERQAIVVIKIRRKGLASGDDSIEAGIQRLQDYIIKNKE